MSVPPLRALQESADKNRALYNYDVPNAKLLETFPTPRPEGLAARADLVVKITVPEFSCLCPLTGQPDFATLHLVYRPRAVCVESKSLKLYLMGFRQFGTFHEACVVRIGGDLIALLDPDFLELRGEFTPRGGIPFHPTLTYVRPVPPAVLSPSWPDLESQSAV